MLKEDSKGTDSMRDEVEKMMEKGIL